MSYRQDGDKNHIFQDSFSTALPLGANFGNSDNLGHWHDSVRFVAAFHLMITTMGLNQSESARIAMNRNVQSVSSCQAAGMMEPPRRVKNKKSQKEGVPDRLPMNFAPSETLKRLLMCEGTGKQMRLWASEYVRIMPEFDGSVRVTRLTRPTIQHAYSYLSILLYFVHFHSFSNIPLS